MVQTAAARLAVPAIIAAFASGCVSFSMFQGPETLDHGQVVGGVGAAIFSVPGDTADDSSLGLWPEAGVRVGLGHRFDLGARFAGVPPFGTFYGDIRYQLVPGPVAVTAGLGGSFVDATFNDDDVSFSAVYPSLAVGSDRLWVAGRGLIVSTGSADQVFVSESIWGLVVGSSIGGDVRLLPEVEVYFGTDATETIVGLGLGVQVDLRDGG
ncbi:MAG: hypothetical protein ACOCUW_03975 [Gemmatimonadota bacterium]